MLEEKISKVVEEFLKEDKDLFLISVLIKGKEPKQKVLVIIDGDNGVNIDQCAAISRPLGHYLDENELISSTYQLEVTSAGIDSPIELPRQYRKNIGRGLKITMNDGSLLEGKLIDVTKGDVLKLEVAAEKKKQEPSVIDVSLDEIMKTFVTVSFK
jgi:ribosome maturation factor RimP